MSVMMPSPAEIEDMYLHIKDNRGPEVVAATAITFALATIAVILRLIARRISKAILLADDWTILAAWIVGLAQVILNMLAVSLGGGKHMIVLKDVSAYAKIVLIAEIVYVLGAALVKWAILLLYRRLFGSNRRFQYVLWSVGAFVSAYSLAEVLVIIFQCRPVDAAWNLSVTPSYCVNMSLGAIIVGALNAATDFLVLLLPIPVVLGLNLKTKWKLQLIGIFLLGGFVCLGSIYRVTILHKLSYFDATWNDVDPAIWAMVENSVGIISACLPTLRPIFNLIARGHHCSAQEDSCARCSRKSRSRSSYVLSSGNMPDSQKPGHSSSVAQSSVLRHNFMPISDLEALQKQPNSVMITKEIDVSSSDVESLKRLRSEL